MAKTLFYGWGVNDADYQVWANNGIPRCPYFRRWHSMVERGYSRKFKDKNYTYEMSTVNSEWQYFSVFKSWMESQIWLGTELDKDVLVMGNKEYGSAACAFVPPYINKILNTSRPVKGTSLPLGVSIKDPRNSGINIYTGQCRPYDGIGSRYLGRFETAGLAHSAWQVAKAVAIENAIEAYRTAECFRQDVSESLYSRVEMLRDDHANHRETFSL